MEHLLIPEAGQQAVQPWYPDGDMEIYQRELMKDELPITILWNMPNASLVEDKERSLITKQLFN